jgi:molybdenum cofactor biosynthesis enzyme MoaA
MIEKSIVFHKKVAPSRSNYKIVYIDVAHRCNMECANCYLPNRSYPDVDTARLKEFIDQFTMKTEFRLIGGEPTLHKDLASIIAHINASPLNHRVGLVTNGLKLASKRYVKQLKAAGLRYAYLSMNGFDNDSVYQVLDNMKCAKLKMKALENCLEQDIFVNIGFIITRGVNEFLLEKMYNYFTENKLSVSFEFRNIGNIGRNMLEDNHIENYDFQEIKSLVFTQFNMSDKNIITEDAYSIFCKNRNFLIRLNDWQSLPSGFDTKTNELRGRMTEDFHVAPFLENILENEGFY